MIRVKKAQSVLEYVVLICIVLSSLMIMQVYIKRTYQGRLKQESDQLGLQYAPGQTTSLVVTKTHSDNVTCTGGKCEVNGQTYDIDEGVTVTWGSTANEFLKKEGVDSFAKK